MGVKELCYKIEVVPDLSLNKYASLDGNGVDGVLEKHLAFLRQWNRKGALSGTSIHLYYYYDGQKEDGTYAIGSKGSKLKILFAVRGDEEKLNNVQDISLIAENDDKTKKYMITASEEVDLRKSIFETFAKEGITIFEMKKVNATLEEAFMELINNENEKNSDIKADETIEKETTAENNIEVQDEKETEEVNESEEKENEDVQESEMKENKETVEEPIETEKKEEKKTETNKIEQHDEQEKKEKGGENNVGSL